MNGETPDTPAESGHVDGPLNQRNWLTDARDAELGMNLVFDRGDGEIVEFEIEQIHHGEITLLLYQPVDSTWYSVTAGEVNQRKDVIVE